MDLYNTFSIVIVLAAFTAFINQRFFKLPNAIGVMIIAAILSLLLLLTSNIFPVLFRDSFKLLQTVNFSQLLISILLNFLLFAGTIRIRITDLHQHQLSVILFSTLSVVISTFIVGFLMYIILQALHMNVPLLQCLLFGALISPTDPVSVLSILKDAKMSKSLETKIAGESLFNDGVALLLFFTILRSVHDPGASITIKEISYIFFKEAVGGLVLGVVLGFIALRTVKGIDDHNIEVMITLAVVMGGYLLAKKLNVSAPLTMVAAGIFIGNYGKKYAMSPVSRDYLDKFWELIEEILNVILFALIGFEILFIKHFQYYWVAGIASIGIVLFARFISLWLPSFVIRLREKMNLYILWFLTWGGLRGGISIALALSLSQGLHKDLFLFTTYCVVLFSIVVQGLSIERLARRQRRKLQRKLEV
ncbi:sodium:proton antiporter [Danxiaibacter flavus]|uniref:Sodium:proton antiporter n=1 Tax=Danxiaibacter flavus TaxID=3049108 RepID=A0ABV3ZKZ0_9BACT|nr:sodium:proton antiporter [Chitinophagaceae bacterium DXS]